MLVQQANFALNLLHVDAANTGVPSDVMQSTSAVLSAPAGAMYNQPAGSVNACVCSSDASCTALRCHRVCVCVCVAVCVCVCLCLAVCVCACLCVSVSVCVLCMHNQQHIIHSTTH